MRVLLATDGSASSAIAAELVGNIRWPSGTMIEAVRVVDEDSQGLAPGPWPAIGLVVPPDIRAAGIQDAEDALVALLEPIRRMGLTTAHSVLRGQPAEALLAWIDRHRPDVVVVGNRGASPLERTLLGSVSAALVDRSPVPVLVARRPTLERVVVAVDGSDIAAEAIATIRRWSFLAAAEIRTLSVAPMPTTPWPGELRHGIADARTADRVATGYALLEHDIIAAEAATSLTAAGFTSQSEVRAGSPAPGIVAFARELDADLVIMGSHGRTGLARLLLGSVARNVLHHASCSVLIVRRQSNPVRDRRVEPVAFPWAAVPSH